MPRQPMLILPRHGRGFVSTRDGTVNLDRVIMACVGAENAQPAMDTLSQLLFSICEKAPQLIVFHVENAGDKPTVVTEADPQSAVDTSSTTRERSSRG